MVYFWLGGDHESKYRDRCHCPGASGQNPVFRSADISVAPPDS